MSSAAVASPDPADANPAVAAIQSVQRRDATTADIADPIELFAHDYDANDGRVASISAPSSGDKRPASPRKKTAAAVSSPVKKKTNVTSSPARRAIGFVAAVGNSISRAVDPPASIIAAPPVVARVDPSPTAIDQLIDAPAPPPAKKKKNSTPRGSAMIGFVPKSAFLT